MKKVTFSDGVKVSNAKVTIDEVDYTVTPARYNGATPLSSIVMNTMQDNIEDAIDQNVNNIGGKEYDNTATYDVGDIVKYQGQLYICTTAITTAEAWNSNHWQATDVLSSAGGNEIAIGSQSDITGKTKIFVEESTQRLKYKDSTTGNFTNIAGDEVFIGDEQDAPESTKLLVDTEDDSWNNIGTEVVDTLSGNEANRAPSVRAVNEALENTEIYSTNEVRVGTYLGKPLYRRVFSFQTSDAMNLYYNHGITNLGKYWINLNASYIISNKESLPVNWYYAPDDWARAWMDAYKIRFRSPASLGTDRTMYLTIEYTKTTD